MIENLVNNLSLYLQGSVLLAFLATYMGGLVISFTPCTYPLIPVTVGLIGAQGSSSKLRGFSFAVLCSRDRANLFHFGRSGRIIGKDFRADANNTLDIFYYG